MRVLVVGDGASICDACVAFAVGQIDYPSDDLPAPGLTLQRAAFKETLSRMGPSVPFAVSGPALAAAAALSTWMTERHNLSLDAMRLRNPRSALLLLDVPGGTPTMLLHAATYWISEGIPGHAVSRLRAIDPAPLPRVDRAHHSLNLVAALLADGAGDDDVEAESSRAEAGLAASGDSPFAVAWRVCVYTSRGDLALHAGDAAAAERWFRLAISRGAGADTATYRRLGDALKAQGDIAGARAAWLHALELAHPEGSHAASPRVRLGS